MEQSIQLVSLKNSCKITTNAFFSECGLERILCSATYVALFLQPLLDQVLVL